jgi:quercetin dioxygenase-like cupin family protein
MTEPRFKKLEREALFDRALPVANPGVRFVKGARIRFAPGQPSGLHRHPVSTCGVVTRGDFTLQVDGEPPQSLRTGDAFFEPAGRMILQFDNASDEAEAEIVCFYLAGGVEQAPIEMLKGGMDSQLGKL